MVECWYVKYYYSSACNFSLAVFRNSTWRWGKNGKDPRRQSHRNTLLMAKLNYWSAQAKLQNPMPSLLSSHISVLTSTPCYRSAMSSFMLSPDICSMICTFFFLIFRSVFCTLKVCQVFKETCTKKKKKLLIAMFYYICLLKSSRIYYCANAAIMLVSCIKTHLSTQGLKEIKKYVIFL